MFVEYFCLLLILGDSVVAVCKDGFVCGVVVRIFVVQTSYEFGQSGRVSVNGISVECLFPFIELFAFDILVYLFV